MRSLSRRTSGRRWRGSPDRATRTGGGQYSRTTRQARSRQALQRRGACVFGAELVALLSPRFEQTLFIIDGHTAEAGLLHLLRRYGGDVVLTGTCLLGVYGAPAAAMAAAELGRPIPPSELTQWRQGIARPGALFLGEVAAAARTLFVPSAWLAREVATRHGRSAIVLPVAADPMVAGSPRHDHRDRCRTPSRSLRLGARAAPVLGDRGPPDAGLPTPQTNRPWRSLPHGYGSATTSASAPVQPRSPQSWPCAAMVERSGPLVAALAAGPCIASLCLAEAIDPPPWLDIIPDQASPPLLARALRIALAQAPPDIASWPADHAPDAVAAAIG